MGLISIFPTHAGILAGLSLFKSLAGNPAVVHFLSAATLIKDQKAVFSSTPQHLALRIFLLPVLHISPSLREKAGDIDDIFKAI